MKNRAKERENNFCSHMSWVTQNGTKKKKNSKGSPETIRYRTIGRHLCTLCKMILTTWKNMKAYHGVTFSYNQHEKKINHTKWN